MEGRGGGEINKRTFFPGLFSISPTAFSSTPLTLSPTVVFRLVAGVAFFLVTPAPVVVLLASARGLEVLALGLPTPGPEAGFLVLVFVLVLVVLVVMASGT